MNRYTLLLSLCGLFAFSACKTKKYTPTSLSETRIHFGDGGGFAGLQNEYVLLENGQLYTHDVRQDSMQALESVRKKICKNLFKELAEMDSDKMGAAQPGNRYFYLEYITPDKKVKTTWGANGYQVDSLLKATYLQLMEQVKEKQVQK
jgi:hypothetical protein